MASPSVVVIGAGPAGLTTAYDLAKHGLSSTLLEAGEQVGGISQTVNYKNFRFDIGGHRFFSKIPMVNDLWHEILGDNFLLRQYDLAISGYWGPMLSWIIAPLLSVVDEPLSAAHMAMGVSSLVYLLGSWAVLRAMGIGSSAMLVALGIVVVFSVHWSVRFITPDLLMSGILFLAVSRIMHPDWCDKPSVQCSGGLLFGAAYLAKAPALPLSFLLILAAASLWTIGQRTGPIRALRSAAITFVGLMIIAGPWILILSLKYERPVFSTSGEISHAVLGPSGVERDHPPFREFHVPENGRITSWEDPNPKWYTHWSPLESTKNFRNQLWITYGNANKIVSMLKRFDWLGIGLVSVIFGFLFHAPWRQNIQSDRWRWSGIFIGCLVMIYLPVYGKEIRYYFSVYPFLLGGSLGFVGYLAKDPSNQTNVLHITASCLVALCFLVPLATVPSIPSNPDYQAAKILTNKLKTIDIFGPIASTSEADHIALYTAFLMEAPYYGKSPQTQTVEEVQSSSAKIIIVDRGDLIDSRLKKDEGFISLDEGLFDSLRKDFDLDVHVYINTKI